MPSYTCATNGNWTTLSPLAAATTFQCQGASCRLTADTPGSPSTNLTLGIVLFDNQAYTFPAGATVSYRSDNGAVRINAEPVG